MNDQAGSGANAAAVAEQVRRLFEQARELPPAERAAFVERHCAGDHAARGELEALLASGVDTPEAARAVASAGRASSSSISTPTLDPASADARKSVEITPSFAAAQLAASAHRIGPYKLLEVVGEGGFGTVWVAEQQSPVRRRVALKIIKAGMDSKTVIARFEQERQALAIMDHPNIAKVFDAGASPDGRPYFVMEYVAGEAITFYCDKHRLNVRQRLELFIHVCDAIQHAHHKGIIHRDLKPTNVMVTTSPDGGPAIKVIDFGVAKAVSHVLTDKTLFTEHGQILGTPEYMSPEQAEMGALDIDTRTDVYSLGVMLYELLAGALPFEAKELRSRGYNEIQRIIREVDPPRPSTRLRSLDQQKSAEIAQRRRAKLEELEGQLRRELEWIPLKAMRKDRDDRYATPAAMADDIRNHLAGRPLTAGPVSVLYRARKFVQRNRIGVAAAAAIVFAVLAGTVVSTVGFVRAARNADMYRQASEEARRQADRAQTEAARLRRVNYSNADLFKNADPHKGENKDVTVRELLAGAADQLDRGALADEPRIDAALRAWLANTYVSLSLWTDAERQWRKSLDLETASVGDDSLEAAYALSGLGHVKMETGKLDEAERMLREALNVQREALAADDPQLGNTINNLGLLAFRRGDLKNAEALAREALAVYQKRPKNVHLIADAMTNLANALHRLGDNKQAISLAREALDMRRQRYGDRHIDVWNSLINLGSMEEAEDQLAQAEQTRRQALALATDLTEEKSRTRVRSLNALARTLWLRGGPEALREAQAVQTRALELAKAVDGERGVTYLHGLNQLAAITRDSGRLDEAIDLFRKEVELRAASQGPASSDTAAAQSSLADALTRAGKAAEAIELARQALETRKRVFPSGHWAVWSTTSVLGAAYAAAGEYDKAEPLLLDAYQGLEAASGSGRRPRVDAAGRLVTLYDKSGKAEQAAKWREQIALLTKPAEKQPVQP